MRELGGFKLAAGVLAIIALIAGFAIANGFQGADKLHPYTLAILVIVIENQINLSFRYLAPLQVLSSIGFIYAKHRYNPVYFDWSFTLGTSMITFVLMRFSYLSESRDKLNFFRFHLVNAKRRELMKANRA